MIDKSGKFVKAIVHRFNYHKLLNNASTTVGNASERLSKLAYMRDVIKNVQKGIDDVKSIATSFPSNQNMFAKQGNGHIIIQDLNAPPLRQTSPIPKRLMIWWDWYSQLTGLSTVESSKQHVIDIQDKLFYCQKQRRDLGCKASAMNEEIKNIYGELLQIRRDDPRYVQLTIMENKTLQECNRVQERLKDIENEEKDYFTQLATAIKEYHDNQAMNAQKMKYLSIIASALLAIISLTGSMIYNNRRIADARYVIENAQVRNEKTFLDNFNHLANRLDKQFGELLRKEDNKQTVNESNLKGQSQSASYSTKLYNNATSVCVISLFVYIFMKSIFG